MREKHERFSIRTRLEWYLSNKIIHITTLHTCTYTFFGFSFYTLAILTYIELLYECCYFNFIANVPSQSCLCAFSVYPYMFLNFVENVFIIPHIINILHVHNYTVYLYTVCLYHIRTLYSFYIFTTCTLCMFHFEFNEIQACMLSDHLHRSQLNYNLIPNVNDLIYKMDE